MKKTLLVLGVYIASASTLILQHIISRSQGNMEAVISALLLAFIVALAATLLDSGREKQIPSKPTKRISPKPNRVHIVVSEFEDGRCRVQLAGETLNALTLKWGEYKTDSAVSRTPEEYMFPNVEAALSAAQEARKKIKRVKEYSILNSYTIEFDSKKKAYQVRQGSKVLDPASMSWMELNNPDINSSWVTSRDEAYYLVELLESESDTNQ